MIAIDFQGGAHGNYLEFVCNSILAKIPVSSPTPFNLSGGSHNKQYLGKIEFSADHYSYVDPIIYFNNQKIISIQIEHDDLLPLSCISYLRAGDYGYDVDELEINTFNKLNNANYSSVLDTLLEKYFSDQNIIASYNSIRGTEWPKLHDPKDFYKLPNWIKDECLHDHQLYMYQLSEHTPDCPRHILREFFKIGFKHPENHGFIQKQNSVVYNPSNDVFYFPYNAFYDIKKFQKYIDDIGKWSGFPLCNSIELNDLHHKFLDLQPFKNYKSFCDSLITKIKNNEEFEFENINLLCESYISAQIELFSNKQLPFNQKTWPKTSKELLQNLYD